MAINRVRIELNSPNHRAILRSQATVEMLADIAAPIAAAAGEGFDVTTHVGANRATVSVRTGTMQAMRAEAQDKALTAAISAGRR